MRTQVGRQRPVAWAPYPGAQQQFLSCPVFEVLYEGTVGSGKTLMLLMDFARDVGRGWGAEWRGYFFRHTFPALRSAVSLARLWFPKVDPGVKITGGEGSTNAVARFSTGEVLLFRPYDTIDDYWRTYHGENIAWAGFDELTTWPHDDCYMAIQGRIRPIKPEIKARLRAATNPGAIGHAWVRNRWQLPCVHPSGIGPILGDGEMKRCSIRGDFRDNKALLLANPHYEEQATATAMALGGDNYVQAHVHGDWDIAAGGMFSDVWHKDVHCLPAFDLKLIPQGWRIDRAYDHGQTHPYSCGWYAESDGSPIEVGDTVYGAIKGDVIRIGEVYGWGGKANVGLKHGARQIAKRIIAWEKKHGLRGRVKVGPADTQIFATDSSDPKKSVAGTMKLMGVPWIKVKKGRDSRSQGWQTIRQYLMDGTPNDDGTREKPGFFVLDTCEHFLRTVPIAPRDQKKPDDIDAKYEDHVCDEVSYRLRARRGGIVVSQGQRRW